MLASDNGPTTKDKSTSVTLATDDPGLVALAGVSTAANQASTNTKLDSIDTAVKRLAPLGPGPGSATASASKIFGFAFTANTVGNFDLTGVAYTGLKTAIDAGKLLMLKATAGCFYNWGTGNITIGAGSTAASSPATQGVPMFDGGESPERAPPGTTHMNILGGPVAGILCVYIAE
ncbi:MAG TPA: hypothetical protein VK550_12345 [Polyangiaceae bacterium]|nr:hypothetical protein [Polyangiaceae bacterium]